MKRIHFVPINPFAPLNFGTEKFEITSNYYLFRYDASFNGGLSLRKRTLKSHEARIPNKETLLSDEEVKTYIVEPQYVLVYESEELEESEIVVDAYPLRYPLIALRLLKPLECDLSVFFSTFDNEAEIDVKRDIHKVYVLPRYSGVGLFEKDLKLVAFFLEKIIQIGERYTNRISAALRAFESSQAAYWDVDKIIYDSICLESLFTLGNEEVTYKLKTRTAWFLGKDPVGRLEIYKRLGYIYKLRSILVHGQLPQLNTSEHTKEKRWDILNVIEEYIRLIFKKIFEDPDLLSLFSVEKSRNRKDFEEYLEALTLNL